jgi:hypothetical protein
VITPIFNITPTDRASPKLALNFTAASLDSRITFARTTGTSNPATYTNSAGLVAAATNNQPRFDYDPTTLACKGLLIEEQRTNLLQYSEQFENAYWSKARCSISANATTAPDGTNAADKMVGLGTGGSYFFRGISMATGVKYAVSIYAKPINLTTLLIQSFSQAGIATFNLIGSGAVQSETGVCSGSSISYVGDGWYRIATVVTATATANNNIGFASASYAGDICYFWGAQVEAGAFASSYIPTTTAALTRNADVATMTGTNFSDWWQGGKGSALVRASPFTVTGIRPPFQTDDGTANNIIALRGNGANPELYVRTGGVDQAQIDAGTIAANTLYRLAGAWATNDCAASLNSGTPVLDGVATIPTVTQARIGSDGTNYLNGHIEAIEYYNERIPNSALQVVSSTAGHQSIIGSVFRDAIIS